MKQKFLMRAGAFWLTAVMLAGCGGQAATNSQPPEESKTESAIESSQEDLQETDSEAEAAAETESEENSQATGNPKGGYPWIDSQIPENVTEGMETSLKDDFYLYTNYEWILGGGNKSEEVPDPDEKIKEQLLDILENEDDSDIHETKLIRDYYNAYKDWDERNKVGLEPLRAVVEDIESISSIEEMSAFISDEDRSRDVDVPIKLTNTFDPNDSTRYCTDMYFSGFSDLLLDNVGEYTDETEDGARVKHAIIEEVVYDLESLGWTAEEATKAAEDTFVLETRLCAGLYSLEDLLMNNVTQQYEFVEKSELKEWMKDFPIEGFLESRGFGKSEQILYDNEGYIKLLGELYNKENLELFKHYMISRYLLKFDYACDEKAVEFMIKTDNAKLGGSDNIYDDFDIANHYMDLYLKNARDKAYLARHDVSRQREVVIDLFNNLKSTYHDMMLENDWISDESRAKIIEKIDAMNIYALYPDNWGNYDSLDFEGKPFAEIAIELMHFNQDQEKKYVESKVDNEREAWKSWNIFVSNAKMIRELNSFMITFEAMDRLNFDLDNISKEELYATVGHIIGHEMSHGFDEYGVKYDKNGQSGDVLTEEDNAALRERLDKIERYYDGITVFEGYNCPGEMLSTEATADMTGMEVLIKMAEKEEDFDFDKFFTAFARNSRSISNYKRDLSNLKTDPHPLFYLRVNTVLQQQDKFHELYDIQEGDGMYLAPEDRVLLW